MASAAQHGRNHRVVAPRQLSAAPAAESNALLLGGISSFAFQGTNAHALLGRQLTAGSCSLPGPTTSFLEASGALRARLWVLPAAHPLIASGGVSGSGAARVATFECHLLAPRLALYADHVVFGRDLFPGAGMLEAALAAGSAVLDAGSPAATAAPGSLAVSGMSISSPLMLPHPGKQQAQQLQRQAGGGSAADGQVMSCSVSPLTGQFQLFSSERPGGKPSEPHAAGTLGLAAAAAVQAAAAVAVRTLAVRRALLGRALAAVATAAAFPPQRSHATGSIAAPQRLANDGYLVPPPCMDACLHLGVAAPGCGAKVPVAVGGFTLADRRAAAASGQLAGSTSAAYEAPSVGSLTTASFALRTPAGGAFASLADLQTKVSQQRGAASKAAAATAAAGPIQPADFLYEVSWQAAEQAEQARPLAGSAWAPQQAATLALDGSVARVGLSAPAHAAGVAALHLVQQAAQASAVAAALPDDLAQGSAAASSAGGSAVLAAGALEGLLRVAATEQADTAYTLTAADSLAVGAAAAAGQLAEQQAEQGILGAVLVRRGVAAVPRLVAR